MKGLSLATPESKYEKEYIKFVEECAGDIQKCGMDHFIPLSTSCSFIEGINHLQDSSKGIGLPDGWVPDSTYWLMTENFDRILGAINIRHKLTDNLLFRGGHIAYYIHQSERRKGYAKLMLSLGLEKCRDMGIEKVLITCAKSNIASARTIMGNGGVLHSEDIQDGEQFQRYWIELRK